LELVNIGEIWYNKNIVIFEIATIKNIY
jgi:hypothetical protein